MEVTVMNKSVCVIAVALTISTAFGIALAEQKSGDAKKGSALFQEKCGTCHPDGGNLRNPNKPIKDLRNKEKIVAKIRKGGNGMTAFDIKSLSEPEAKHIADYVSGGCGQ
jgi:cytochrome c6